MDNYKRIHFETERDPYIVIVVFVFKSKKCRSQFLLGDVVGSKSLILYINVAMYIITLCYAYLVFLLPKSKSNFVVKWKVYL